MRLLNVNTLKLSEFFEAEIPPYAILSHRWGEDEVLYKNFVEERNCDGKGYRKIINFCNFAGNFQDSKVEWVWVDTCEHHLGFVHKNHIFWLWYDQQYKVRLALTKQLDRLHRQEEQCGAL